MTVLIATQVANLGGASGEAVTSSIVDKCVVHNTGATAVTVALHIIPSGGGAPAPTNRVGVTVVAANYTYHCPELVGAWLNTGDTIAVVPSVASVLTVYAGSRP